MHNASVLVFVLLAACHVHMHYIYIKVHYVHLCIKLCMNVHCTRIVFISMCTLVLLNRGRVLAQKPRRHKRVCGRQNIYSMNLAPRSWWHESLCGLWQGVASSESAWPGDLVNKDSTNTRLRVYNNLMTWRAFSPTSAISTFSFPSSVPGCHSDRWELQKTGVSPPFQTPRRVCSAAHRPLCTAHASQNPASAHATS